MRSLEIRIAVTLKCFFFFYFFSDEQLHVVYLEPAPREKCEEESEVGAGTICTQEKSNVSDCNVSTYE